jgi:hypothetical protein
MLPREQIDPRKQQQADEEQKRELLRIARSIGASLPERHPARGYFMLGLHEKGLERLSPEWEKLVVSGADGKPQIKETLVRIRGLLLESGKNDTKIALTSTEPANGQSRDRPMIAPLGLPITPLG